MLSPPAIAAIVITSILVLAIVVLIYRRTAVVVPMTGLYAADGDLSRVELIGSELHITPMKAGRRDAGQQLIFQRVKSSPNRYQGFGGFAEIHVISATQLETTTYFDGVQRKTARYVDMSKAIAEIEKIKAKNTPSTTKANTTGQLNKNNTASVDIEKEQKATALPDANRLLANSDKEIVNATANSVAIVHNTNSTPNNVPNAKKMNAKTPTINAAVNTIANTNNNGAKNKYSSVPYFVIPTEGYYIASLKGTEMKFLVFIDRVDHRYRIVHVEEPSSLQYLEDRNETNVFMWNAEPPMKIEFLSATQFTAFTEFPEPQTAVFNLISAKSEQGTQNNTSGPFQPGLYSKIKWSRDSGNRYGLFKSKGVWHIYIYGQLLPLKDTGNGVEFTTTHPYSEDQVVTVKVIKSKPSQAKITGLEGEPIEIVHRGTPADFEEWYNTRFQT